MVLAVSLLVLGARDAGQHRRACPSVSHHHQQSLPPCKANENSQYAVAKGKAEPSPTKHSRSTKWMRCNSSYEIYILHQRLSDENGNGCEVGVRIEIKQLLHPLWAGVPSPLHLDVNGPVIVLAYANRMQDLSRPSLPSSLQSSCHVTLPFSDGSHLLDGVDLPCAHPPQRWFGNRTIRAPPALSPPPKNILITR
ncbi:hypothetical protein BHE74_00046391 [Ensete ventricosum]|nr:hypothetical protein BHE74_00046391 [Ensete ventricosum]